MCAVSELLPTAMSEREVTGGTNSDPRPMNRIAALVVKRKGKKKVKIEKKEVKREGKINMKE